MMGTAILFGALMIAGAIDNQGTEKLMESPVFWIVVMFVVLGDIAGLLE